MPNSVRSPLKWAGGKTWMYPYLDKLNFPTKVGCYYEPFLGGGGLYKYFIEKLTWNRAVISDAQTDLMLTMKAIKKAPLLVGKKLKQMASLHDKEYYYRVRARFNRKMEQDIGLNRAIMFLYMNAKCFNGLCRYNKNGGFNSPIHPSDHMKRKVPTITILREWSKLLQRALLATCDFRSLFENYPPLQGDFVVLDPPYVPYSITSNFTSYTAEGFEYREQKALADLCSGFNTRGVKFIAFNHDVEAVRNLYGGFNFLRVMTKRRIGNKAKSKSREVYELIITNF